uniref:3-hydroxyacyl-CoA dehydrogenase n=1 Tax=Heterorhabditis bacteriophora TaxID=37862 RepID=A0A1I7X0W5_HETBA
MEFLIFPMVNEGYLCLEEGMIRGECLIDIMFINVYSSVLGFGWPMASGGPMVWGRQIGLHKIGERIRHWHHLEICYWITYDFLE